MKVTMLGAGGSQGVPTPLGDWGVCDPNEPRNYRRRPSVLVEAPDGAGTLRQLLIDTGPDLREQLIRTGVHRIDAVLYTHSHADHVHGIDELRTVNKAMGEPIPLYASAVTLEEIRQRFAYAVAPPHPEGHFFRPTMLPNIFDGPFEAAGVKVIPFEQDHGFSPSWGFRIGDFAYSTDVVQLDERAFAVLEGIKLWIVDGLREAPHPTHSHIERTLEWIARVKPDRAFLTHMDNNTDYAVTAARLPAGVEPGYDGLVVEL